MKKNRRNSGETLAETLAAILLTTISSILFFQMSMAAAGISKHAKEMEDKYRNALTKVEEQQTAYKSGSVSVDGRDYEVEYFSDDAGELVSYSSKKGS